MSLPGPANRLLLPQLGELGFQGWKLTFDPMEAKKAPKKKESIFFKFVFKKKQRKNKKEQERTGTWFCSSESQLLSLASAASPSGRTFNLSDTSL